MKNTFSVSLCKNGLLGGWIIFDEEAMTYKTGKLTIPPKYRNLKMKYSDILSVTKGKLLFLTTVSVQIRDDEEYKFLVFEEDRFLKMLDEKRNHK